MPFVWCAVGAHVTPHSPKAPNPLLAAVFQSSGLFSVTADGKSAEREESRGLNYKFY